MSGPARVALVGAHGHGGSYLERLARLDASGIAHLVAVADPRPPGELAARAGDAQWFTSTTDLLARTAPDVIILSTPIPTHLPLASEAVRAGCDVLLEKPTTASWAQHTELLAAVRSAGRLCQVGFQTFGSDAFTVISAAVERGEIGEVTGVGGLGTWVRTTGYWNRARWSGRRRLDGVDVVDGVVTNPLAHAVATALRVVDVTRDEQVASVTTDLYRANPIEADDTSAVRVTTTDGLDVGFGLTLCAERREPARIVVHGTRGEITLAYETDTVTIQGSSGTRRISTGRADLLENLLSARHTGEPLLCDIEDTGAFMRVLEAVRAAPDPTPIAPAFVRWDGEGDDRRPVVADVERWCEAAAREQRTFAELGAPWTRDAVRAGDRTVATIEGCPPL